MCGEVVCICMRQKERNEGRNLFFNTQSTRERERERDKTDRQDRDTKRICNVSLFVWLHELCCMNYIHYRLLYIYMNVLSHFTHKDIIRNYRQTVILIFVTACQWNDMGTHLVNCFWKKGGRGKNTLNRQLKAMTHTNTHAACKPFKRKGFLGGGGGGCNVWSNVIYLMYTSTGRKIHQGQKTKKFTTLHICGSRLLTSLHISLKIHPHQPILHPQSWMLALSEACIHQCHTSPISAPLDHPGVFAHDSYPGYKIIWPCGRDRSLQRLRTPWPRPTTCTKSLMVSRAIMWTPWGWPASLRVMKTLRRWWSTEKVWGVV